MVVYNLVYLGLVGVGVLFFAVIFLSTRPAARAKPVSVAGWKRRENAWLYVVIAALLAALAATILETPWHASAAANRQIVKVTGRQFGFTFSTKTMHVGRQVEFQLSAPDVNHAFAVYDPSGTLIAQAQMMPDHPQTLRITFTKPGTYTVHCFEYCGAGHHLMSVTFRVIP
jgi:cytochrome c oxidase subunit 2